MLTPTSRATGRLALVAVAGSVALLAACASPVGDLGAGVTHERIGETIAYGDGPEQVADLVTPAGAAPDSGWPTAVLVHGGFWRDEYRRDLMVPLAEDLVARGFATWNLEYRRVGPTGGGVPQTLADVAAAIDHLAVLVRAGAPLDTDRVSVIGHSAGGQLALWAGSRARLPAGAPGATGGSAGVIPCAVVGQAPVASLRDATTLGGGAVVDLLGGLPDVVPDAYALADPLGLVGHGVPTLLVHGEADDVVPLDQSERYESAATSAGDPVELRTFVGDHFSVIDPEDPSWTATVAFLERRC